MGSKNIIALPLRCNAQPAEVSRVRQQIRSVNESLREKTSTEIGGPRGFGQGGMRGPGARNTSYIMGVPAQALIRELSKKVDAAKILREMQSGSPKVAQAARIVVEDIVAGMRTAHESRIAANS